MFITFLVVDLIIAVLLVTLVLSLISKDKEEIKFTFLNEKRDDLISTVKNQFASDEDLEKEKSKKKKDNNKKGKRSFILTFKGDVLAEEVEKLRHEISAILNVCKPGDEVFISLDSPGGTVSGYGLVASELSRFKARGIKLTAMVDRVAASGGYMAAVVADKIYAAPFAYIGSIGVVTEFPNFSKLLNKYGVEWKTYTAGESKRDVGTFGKVTPDAEKRLNKKLGEIHGLFKNHILNHRKQVNVKKVATGECWTAQEALKMHLIDGLGVSDDIIMEQMDLM